MRLSSSLVVATLVCWTAQANTGSISGTVTDASGAVIPGAKVGLAGAAETVVRTNASGVFTLSELQPGTHELKFQEPGFTDRELSVGVKANEQTQILVVLDVKAIFGCENSPAPLLPTITLEKLRDRSLVRISGVVRNGAAGSHGVSVTLRPAYGAVLVGFTLTDETGAYRIEDVPPQLYELVFEKDDQMPVIVDNVRTERGYETKLSPVSMQASITICL